MLRRPARAERRYLALERDFLSLRSRIRAVLEEATMIGAWFAEEPASAYADERTADALATIALVEEESDDPFLRASEEGVEPVIASTVARRDRTFTVYDRLGPLRKRGWTPPPGCVETTLSRLTGIPYRSAPPLDASWIAERAREAGFGGEVTVESYGGSGAPYSVVVRASSAEREECDRLVERLEVLALAGPDEPDYLSVQVERLEGMLRRADVALHLLTGYRRAVEEHLETEADERRLATREHLLDGLAGSGSD